MENNQIWAILLLGIFLFMSQSNSTIIVQQPSQGNNSNLEDLIDASVSLTGIDKYVPGTSLSGELARAFRLNGGRTDLGTKSLDSGILNVKPNTNYKIYFFMNETSPDTNYYVDARDYTGKLQDSSDNLAGIGCSIDTTPKIIVRNPGGNVQTSRTNAYALGASSSANFEIEIKASSDKCYGTPNSPKKNAICFVYDTSEFSKVQTNTKWIGPIRSVVNLEKESGQEGLSCYEFNLLENAASDTLTVQLTSNGNPQNNITIFTDDIGFDLNKANLNEIWDFTDEDGNQLARVINATPDGFIYLS